MPPELNHAAVEPKHDLGSESRGALSPPPPALRRQPPTSFVRCPPPPDTHLTARRQARSRGVHRMIRLRAQSTTRGGVCSSAGLGSRNRGAAHLALSKKNAAHMRRARSAHEGLRASASRQRVIRARGRSRVRANGSGTWHVARDAGHTGRRSARLCIAARSGTTPSSVRSAPQKGAGRARQRGHACAPGTAYALPRVSSLLFGWHVGRRQVDIYELTIARSFLFVGGGGGGGHNSRSRRDPQHSYRRPEMSTRS